MTNIRPVPVPAGSVEGPAPLALVSPTTKPSYFFLWEP